MNELLLIEVEPKQSDQDKLDKVQEIFFRIGEKLDLLLEKIKARKTA